MRGSTTSNDAEATQKRSATAFVATVGVAATVLVSPLVYAAQRHQDPDIAVSQTVSTVVAGLLGTAVATFLVSWAGRDLRRVARTAVTLAVATLVVLPLAWWSPLPIATGVAANRLGRMAEHSEGTSNSLVRVAALAGVVLAALGATALVVASVVALV